MFLTPLKVESVRGTDERILLTSLIWRSAAGDDYIVPEGFKTNYASIPQILRSIIDNDDPVLKDAAVLHDYLYSLPKFTREEADNILREAMKDLGAPWWKRQVVYYSVRIAGASHKTLPTSI